MKRIIIVLSGQVASDTGLFSLLSTRDVLICADGGARHLHRLNCLPDMLVGDLDSIDPTDLAWIEQNQVPIQRFPSVKDQTDAELAVEIALQVLEKSTLSLGESPIISGEIEIVFLAALGGRPDHVLANQLMAVQLAEKGFRVMMSDGVSRLYPLAGPCHFELRLPEIATIDIIHNWPKQFDPCNQYEQYNHRQLWPAADLGSFRDPDQPRSYWIDLYRPALPVIRSDTASRQLPRRQQPPT